MKSAIATTAPERYRNHQNAMQMAWRQDCSPVHLNMRQDARQLKAHIALTENRPRLMQMSGLEKFASAETITTAELLNVRLNSDHVANSNKNAKKQAMGLNSQNRGKLMHVESGENTKLNGHVSATESALQMAFDKDRFTSKQRAAAIKRNKREMGKKRYIVCENKACGFKHEQVRYALRNGKRVPTGEFQYDHIKHKSKGGKANSGNGRILCGMCNISRGNRNKARTTGRKVFSALHGGKKTKDYIKFPRARGKK